MRTDEIPGSFPPHQFRARCRPIRGVRSARFVLHIGLMPAFLSCFGVAAGRTDYSRELAPLPGRSVRRADADAPVPDVYRPASVPRRIVREIVPIQTNPAAAVPSSLLPKSRDEGERNDPLPSPLREGGRGRMSPHPTEGSIPVSWYSRTSCARSRCDPPPRGSPRSVVCFLIRRDDREWLSLQAALRTFTFDLEAQALSSRFMIRSAALRVRDDLPVMFSLTPADSLMRFLRVRISRCSGRPEVPPPAHAQEPPQRASGSGLRRSCAKPARTCSGAERMVIDGDFRSDFAYWMRCVRDLTAADGNLLTGGSTPGGPTLITALLEVGAAACPCEPTPRGLPVTRPSGSRSGRERPGLPLPQAAPIREGRQS